MDNPTTEDTTVPTTDTPISEVPSAAPAESEAGETVAAPAEAEPVATSDTTSADAAASDATPVVEDAEQLPEQSPVATSGLPAEIAPHLEAIYSAALKHAATTATPAPHADLKAHASDMLHAIRNGIAIAEGDFVQKLEKLVSLL